MWLDVSDGNHPDIALFHLSSKAPMSNKIKTIRLPSLSQENYGFQGAQATAIGWGGVAGGGLSRYLQYTKFNILSSFQCNLGGSLMCSQPPSGSFGPSLAGGDSVRKLNYFN